MQGWIMIALLGGALLVGSPAERHYYPIDLHNLFPSLSMHNHLKSIRT